MSARRRVAWIPAGRWERSGHPPLIDRLEGALAVGLRGVWPEDRCADLVRRIEAARPAWTADFGGEQYALGRAFYTHLETGKADLYFAGAAASDATVEGVLPGLQSEVCALAGAMLGGTTRPRPGFCGPGVHVFPAGEKVAGEGGVIHFDTEGLTPRHLARRARAVTLVVALGLPDRGGALRLWDIRYAGRDAPTEDELASPSSAAHYRPGDALLLDSYRLHQIEPFRGTRDRITATVHAAEIDDHTWETWF